MKRYTIYEQPNAYSTHDNVYLQLYGLVGWKNGDREEFHPELIAPRNFYIRVMKDMMKKQAGMPAERLFPRLRTRP